MTHFDRNRAVFQKGHLEPAEQAKTHPINHWKMSLKLTGF